MDKKTIFQGALTIIIFLFTGILFLFYYVGGFVYDFTHASPEGADSDWGFAAFIVSDKKIFLGYVFLLLLVWVLSKLINIDTKSK